MCARVCVVVRVFTQQKLKRLMLSPPNRLKTQHHCFCAYKALFFLKTVYIRGMKLWHFDELPLKFYPSMVLIPSCPPVPGTDFSEILPPGPHRRIHSTIRAVSALRVLECCCSTNTSKPCDASMLRRWSSPQSCATVVTATPHSPESSFTSEPVQPREICLLL